MTKATIEYVECHYWVSIHMQIQKVGWLGRRKLKRALKHLKDRIL